MAYVLEREELIELLEEAGCSGAGIPVEWDESEEEDDTVFRFDELQGEMI